MIWQLLKTIHKIFPFNLKFQSFSKSSSLGSSIQDFEEWICINDAAWTWTPTTFINRSYSSLARSLRSYFQSNSRSHWNLGFKRPTFYCFCIEERIGDFLKKILQYRFRSISWPKNDAKWRKIFTVDCGVDRSVRHDLSMSVPLTPFKARVFISLSKNSIPNVIFTFFIYLHY